MPTPVNRIAVDYRIPLSQPEVGADERAMLLNAFDAGSLDSSGPNVEAFEADMATYLGGGVHPVALISESAALHVALMLAGVTRGDEVLCPTLARSTTVSAIAQAGARPVLIDSRRDTWNIDTELVVDELQRASRDGRGLGAVVTVDLYGQCADHTRLVEVANDLGVPVIEDATDALGAACSGQPAGTLADFGVFSFGPEQVITTSEGGMLVARNQAHASAARELAGSGTLLDEDHAQPGAGLDYRLSDLLAAVGRAQLRSIESRVARRREIHQRYRDQLGDLPGLAFQGDLPEGLGTRMLTCCTIEPREAPRTRDGIVAKLQDARIDARPVLQPLHVQSALASSRRVGGAIAQELHETGLCLPSGSTLSDAEVDEVADIVAAVMRDL